MRSLLRENLMIKQLLNSVIAKYRDLRVSRRSVICRSRIIDLFATDNSRYFAQPRPIIVNCVTHASTQQSAERDKKIY